MKHTSTPTANKPKKPLITQEQLDDLNRRIYSHDVVLDEEEAKIWYELSKKNYEDTLEYEREQKQRRRN